jgi:hypothetical protein
MFLRTLFAMVLCVLAAAAWAQEDTPLSVELNKLEPQDTACRVYFVMQNGAGSPFEALKLDLVVFDTEGVIARRVAVEGAPLAVDKTVVKLFDLRDLTCESIGRILLNDVLACRDAGGDREDCTALIKPSSRANVPFGK